MVCCRSQVDEFFLASQLRLNGERLQKKSHKVLTALLLIFVSVLTCLT